MLNEAVKHLKEELDGVKKEEESYTTTVDLNVDAYIPSSYIPNEYQKLDVYKRIAGIESEEEMDDSSYRKLIKPVFLPGSLSPFHTS